MLQPNDRRTDADRFTRRSALIRSIILAGLSGIAIGPETDAEEPDASDSKTQVRTAVQRLVRQTASQTIRLRPVSRDFRSVLVQAIATDPRGEFLAVAGDDHAIRVMKAASLQVIATLQGHTDLIQTLDFSSDGKRLVSAGNDGQLFLRNREDDFSVIQRMEGTPALACVRFSPDGREMAAVGFDDKVYVIGRTPRKGQPEVECNCTDLRAVEYRKDGFLLAVAGRSGRLHLFERPSYQLLGDYQVHSGRIHAIRFAEESSIIVSAGEDGHIAMFDTDEKRVVSRFRVARGKLFSVCILDREHLAVAGSDNHIRIVNVVSGKTVDRLEGHTGSIAALAASDNMLFSGGFDATLRRWQLTGLNVESDRIAERDPALDR